MLSLLIRLIITNAVQLTFLLSKRICIVHLNIDFQQFQAQIRTAWLLINSGRQQVYSLFKLAVGNVDIRLTDDIFCLGNRAKITFRLLIHIAQVKIIVATQTGIVMRHIEFSGIQIGIIEVEIIQIGTFHRTIFKHGSGCLFSRLLLFCCFTILNQFIHTQHNQQQKRQSAT